jgi:hypothetical protein
VKRQTTKHMTEIDKKMTSTSKKIKKRLEAEAIGSGPLLFSFQQLFFLFLCFYNFDGVGTFIEIVYWWEDVGLVKENGDHEYIFFRALSTHEEFIENVCMENTWINLTAKIEREKEREKGEEREGADGSLCRRRKRARRRRKSARPRRRRARSETRLRRRPERKRSGSCRKRPRLRKRHRLKLARNL